MIYDPLRHQPAQARRFVYAVGLYGLFSEKSVLSL